MYRYATDRAGVLLAGCLLMGAMAGCQFHRNGSGGWFSTPDFAGRQDAASRGAEPAIAGTTSKPELLPWRTRLKGRLAARFLGRKGPDGAAGWAGSGATPSTGLATAPPRLPPPPDEPNDDNPEPASARASGLQVPSSVLLTPEPRPPAPVGE